MFALRPIVLLGKYNRGTVNQVNCRIILVAMSLEGVTLTVFQLLCVFNCCAIKT